MIVLALDTATPDTVVGLTGAGTDVAPRHTPQPGERPGHARELLVLAAQALSQNGIGWEDVDRIGVGVGPGTFTGLRIGVSTARALAQSCGAQLVAVSTLHALAAGAQASPVLACLDARRGEAFTAGWRAGRQVWPAAATQPQALAALVGPGWQAVGDGALRFRAELEAAGAEIPSSDSPCHRVDGLVLCTLAGAGAVIEREALAPDYVRAPDAKERVPAASPPPATGTM